MKAATQQQMIGKGNDQTAYAMSGTPTSGKEGAPVAHQRGSVGGARRAIPRHPNLNNERHMVAGYRPNYKEGY